MVEVESPVDVAGGDYVETTFGLIYGLSVGAGVIGSGGLVLAALGIGAALILYDEL